ncbi:MAG: TVP38/TMEM64 family protein [Gammaproteobacteria bacterium]|nr:TVP38/TMEM64 family protein [Gammaproteobacteria bacterium]
MGETHFHTPGSRFKSPLWAIAASVLFVAAIVGVLVYFGVHEELVALIRWTEDQGPWAALIFILMMALVVVLLLPGIFFTTGAGFVFGVMEGSAYVVLGTTLGACIAFLLARHLFGRRAARFIVAHGKMSVLNDEMSHHGWKVVLLTRLIPFFPAKLSNYVFGLTSFSFSGFAAGSLVGFIPFSVNNVYLGAIAGDVVTLGEREIGRTPLEWALYGGGFLVTVFTVIYLNKLARRALARYAGEEPDDQRGQTP